MNSEISPGSVKSVCAASSVIVFSAVDLLAAERRGGHRQQRAAEAVAERMRAAPGTILPIASSAARTPSRW